MTDDIPNPLDASDASDTSDTSDAADDPEWERPVDRFRKSAAGSMVAAGLLGLRDVMEGRPEKEEVTIVNEAPARPIGDLDVVIDPEHPERTVAIVRRARPENDDGATSPKP
ncbi:MAG: hypothetical protein MUP97_01035 [Acidimicrobiia bacterium]|nr:hypothetical protein [Acidimicrobiia bacterium]